MLVSRVAAAQPPSFAVSLCWGISRASLPPQHLLTFSQGHKQGVPGRRERGAPFSLKPSTQVRCHPPGSRAAGRPRLTRPPPRPPLGWGAQEDYC